MYAVCMDARSFALYLTAIRELRPTTAEHYQESLRKINEFLQKRGDDLYQSVYDIDSYAELQRIERLLKEDPEFHELDERGNRMYSAGLHRYMEFAKGVGFTRTSDALALIDHPCPVPEQTTVRSTVFARDRIIVRQVLAAEHYQCESNPDHHTFISQSHRTPYMEGHHLIPLRDQTEFSTSLDVYANIVSLCPICHRLLHYGLKEDKEKVFSRLFDEREDRLVDSGLRLGRKEFLELAEMPRTTSYPE